MDQVKHLIPTSRLKEGFPIELILVLALCRYKIKADNAFEIKAAIDENSNWPFFIKLLRTHKIVPILYSVIFEFKDLFPEGVFNQVKKLFENNRRRMLTLTSELIVLNDNLKKEGIPVIWVKGPALAQRLFGDPVIRSSSDLDLLVLEKDFAAADTFFCNHGFEPSVEWKKFPASFFRKWMKITKHIRYVHPLRKITLELHWELSTPSRLFNFSLEKLFANRSIIQIQQHEIPVLPDFENFIQLVIHGSSHEWAALCWLMDISVLTNGNEKEWKEKLEVYKKENNLSDRISDGLLLVSSMILNKEVLLNKHQQQMVLKWKGPNFRSSPGSFDKLFHYLYIAGFSRKLNFKMECIKNAWLSQDEVALLPLPGKLFFLHYFIRPFLFIYKVYLMKTDAKK